MNKSYAALYFGPEEAGDFRNFLDAMVGLHIIELSKEEIDENIKEFEKIKVGTTCRLVLHNEQEYLMFKHCMQAFFKEKEFKITDNPDDETFAKWLEDKEKKTTA